MNETLTKWAACIVYYEGEEHLLALLASLEKQSLPPFKVFIADNNSTKFPNLKDYSFPVQVCKAEKNLGFAGGANLSINAAITNNFCNFILFSQDVLLEINSSEKLIEALQSKKGLVFPTMWDRKNNTIFSKGGRINKFTGSIKLSKKLVPHKPDWADGSCLVFTKNLFNSIDGFSNKYFMYFEDVDFCYRAKVQGFSLTHVDTNVSQIPNGPNPFFRGRNSVVFARRTNSIVLKLTVTLRNFLGILFLLLKFRVNDGLSRFKGVLQGWGINID